jgi:hypothetical protein
VAGVSVIGPRRAIHAGLLSDNRLPYSPSGGGGTTDPGATKP